MKALLSKKAEELFWQYARSKKYGMPVNEFVTVNGMIYLKEEIDESNS